MYILPIDMYSYKHKREGIFIRKNYRYIIAIILILFVVQYCTINVGGDGRSFSVKYNNETVCAYADGVDITEEFQSIEENARKAITKYYEGQEIEFYDFCHLGDTLNMTIDISVNNSKFYTITWKNEEIDCIRELDKEYVDQWYRFDKD